MSETRLDLPHFGLPPEAWERRGASCDVVIHCAQRETQDQNLERAREANVQPVENLLLLLARHPELRLHHLSTAFAGWTRPGPVPPFHLPCLHAFPNFFDRRPFLPSTT